MESGGAGRGVELAPGEEFAGHRIESVIGRGGMGIVYRARNLALDRDRALKVLAPTLSGNPRFRERFQRESRLAASLEHPNVLPVHDAGERDGLLYIAMRLAEGQDLRDLVGTSGPLDPGRALSIVRGVAAALDAAHAAGLVHRDVKPANVLVEPLPGGKERVFLTDFGISRTAARGETVTASGEIVGSADFMAPEQIAGERVGPAADVYALGALAYFALTGQPPFPRETELATLFAHANASRPRASDARAGIPAAVDDAIAHAMAIAPPARPASAGAFAVELEAALAGVAPPTDTATRHLVAPPARRRRAWLAGALVLGAAIVAAVAVALLTGRDEDAGGDSRGGAGDGEPPPPVTTKDFPAGEGPTGLTVAADRVWVADNIGNQVLELDPKDGRSLSAPVAMTNPSSVAAGLGSTWAVSGSENTVYEIRADGSRVPIPVAGNPSDIAVDSRSVWVTQEGEGRLARIDPEAGAVEATIPVGTAARAVATGLGAVWVANIEGGTVVRVDPATGKIDGTPIPIGEEDSRPTDVAVGGGAVWVADFLYGNLVRIGVEGGDPSVTATIPIGGRLRGVKYGFGYAWAASADDDALYRVDPATNEVVGEPIPVGPEPADVAVGDGSIWTANEGSQGEGAGITRATPARAG